MRSNQVDKCFLAIVEMLRTPQCGTRLISAIGYTTSTGVLQSMHVGPLRDGEFDQEDTHEIKDTLASSYGRYRLTRNGDGTLDMTRLD